MKARPRERQGMYLRAGQALRDFVDLEKTSLDDAMRVAAPLARGRLLDVGCGDKPYEALFTPYVTQYLGAELAETYSDSYNAGVREAKRKADVLYSGDRLPFQDGEFDTVLCNQVGEHVQHPEAFFAEIVRVLKAGGRLIFTVPFSFRIHSEPHDFHRFTRYALAKYAEWSGLTVDVLAARGGFWKVIGQKLTSHMALRFARLGGDVQRLGGLGYEHAVKQRPRYWVLPVVAPAIVGVAAAARLLDRVDRDETDTMGYLLVATKKSGS
jgi:SAM-dependent methyltransferase